MEGNFKIGDPILHIELRRWADIVLVAPCSANTLSKIAHGLCDNLAVSEVIYVLLHNCGSDSVKIDFPSSCIGTNSTNICISSHEHPNVRTPSYCWTPSHCARYCTLWDCWSYRQGSGLWWYWYALKCGDAWIWLLIYFYRAWRDDGVARYRANSCETLWSCHSSPLSDRLHRSWREMIDMG